MGRPTVATNDVKYVQTAAGIAFNAVLLALDEFLLRKEQAKFTRPTSIEEYRARIANTDKKILRLLNTACDSLLLAGYYYGSPSVKTITSGFADAYAIIEYIKE